MYKKIVNSDNKKLCNKTMSMEETAVVAQPGIALSVNNFIEIIIAMARSEIMIIIKEKIKSLLAMISTNTPMAPKP